MPIFKKDDIEIFYIQEGEGTPLVLIPGYSVNHKEFYFQIENFKSKMMVIAVDNRGSGKSSRPNFPYTMDMAVDDVKHLLDHLEIKERIHLCGQSMGGMIAQAFVLKYPELVKTLILCSTSPKHDATLIYETFKLMADQNMTPEQEFSLVMSGLYSRAFRKKLKENKELYELLMKNSKEDPLTAQDFKNQLHIVKTHDTLKDLEKITVPTLIFGGTKDLALPYSNSELLNDKIPNSTLKSFNGLGHGLIHEAEEQVNDEMWNFIQQNS